MRLLCLHGMGTNAQVLRAQTESFRALLPSHYSYHFCDGDYDTNAADGVKGIFPAPHRCYYPRPTSCYVSRAHELICDIVEDEGPFDAIMGFSQGAALAALVLLHWQMENLHAPAPFRFAVFICASLPYAVDKISAVNTATKYRELFTSAPFFLQKDLQPLFTVNNKASLSAIEHSSQSLSYSANTSSASSVFSIEDRNTNTNTSTSISGNDSETPSTVTESIRRFHPDVDTTRISIPTVHILGRSDPLAEQGRLLAKLCEGRLTRSYEHGEGHNVPRSRAESRAIARAVEAVAELSEMA